MCRAKWLDSDVVVKVLKPVGNAGPCTAISVEALWSDTCSVIHRTEPDGLSTTDERTEAMRMFQREVSIWFRLSHPHVVRPFGACHVGRPFFVCEYASNGTLANYVRAHPDQLWLKLLESALGVLYLHERAIVHGDLKGNNIVVGSDGKAKVTDFGLSLAVSQSDEDDGKSTGAWHWMAPECLGEDNPPPTFASDVYSLGMCTIEAMRAVEARQLNKSEQEYPSLPWGSLGNAEVKWRSTRGHLPQRPSICSDE